MTEDPSRPVLASLYELENAVRALPPDRKDAAVRLIVDRIRRLREDRSRPGAAAESRYAQLDIEDVLRERAKGG